jgi:hypothetical protein
MAKYLHTNSRRLLRIAAAKSAEDMRNHIEFLSAWS